jgi:tRNA/tmRNA/rRNA uracil-C5-methylase (TrmA/RlmC/RlmD family)
MISNGKNITSKYKENKQMQHKETNTLDNKHRQMVKQFKDARNEKEDILNKIENINIEINNISDINEKALLLDKKEDLNNLYKIINSNYDEMDYYDNAGDLISDYYEKN